MFNKKEHELMALKWDMPKGYDFYTQKQIRNKNEFSDIRRTHMMELKAKGVMMSQIARLYQISRQRVYKIIKG